MGPFLIWIDDVVVELAIQVVKVVISGAGAVVLEVAPIHVMVVDEAAVEAAGRRAARGRAPPRWRRRRGCGCRPRGRRGLPNRPSGRSRRDRGWRRRARRPRGFPPGDDARVERDRRCPGRRASAGCRNPPRCATRTPQGRKASAMRATSRDEVGREQARIGVDVVDGRRR